MNKLYLLISCLIFSCSDNSDTTLNPDQEPGFGSLIITIRKASLAKSAGTSAFLTVDSVEIFITGNNMNTLEEKIKIKGSQLTMNNIPPGKNRLVEVMLYDTAGVLIYSGSKTGVNFTAGEETKISISCQPRFSEVNAGFTLGVDNKEGISSGILRLINGDDTVSANLEIIGGERAVFSIPYLEGGKKYEVQAELKLADGTIAYENSPGDSVNVKIGESVSITLNLISKLGQVALDLTLEEQGQLSIGAKFPASAKRAPSPKEIIITEFYAKPTPEDGGNDFGEWLEIYNRTSDTLLMEDCWFEKNRGKTKYQIEKDFYILPGEALVFGGDSVSFRDYSLNSFELTNTKQPTILICDTSAEVVLDSILYTSEYVPQDSIYYEEYMVASIKKEKLGEPSIMDNWCLTNPTGDDTHGLPTPKNPISDCR